MCGYCFFVFVLVLVGDLVGSSSVNFSVCFVFNYTVLLRSLIGMNDVVRFSFFGWFLREKYCICFRYVCFSCSDLDCASWMFA